MLKKALILVAALAMVPTVNAAIIYDAGPGTGAPGATLGPYTMTPFGMDPQPTQVDVMSVASPLGGTLDFSQPMNHRRIGDGWATWSHGYMGDVYYSNESTNMTMFLPAGTAAFYFYTEPNPFDVHTFTVTAQDGTSATFDADGSGGAVYSGFYGTGGSSLASITVNADTGVDFAIGEFGIAVPEPTSLALFGAGVLALIRRRR